MSDPRLSHRSARRHGATTERAEEASVPGRATLVATPLAPVPARPSRDIAGHYGGSRGTATVRADGTALDATIVVGGATLAVAATLAWDNTGSTGYRGDAVAATGDGNQRVTLTFSRARLRIQLGADVVELDRDASPPIAASTSATAGATAARAAVETAIDAADPDALRTIANNLHDARLLVPGPDGLLTVELADRSARIDPADLEALIARADGRLASCAAPDRPTTPEPEPAIAPPPIAPPVSRAALTAAVEAARDIAELEVAIASIDDLGESPAGGIVEIVLSAASHVVAARDVTWLRAQLVARLAAVRAVSPDLVAPRVDAPIDPMLVDERREVEEAAAADPRAHEFRAAGTFGIERRFPTLAGVLRLEAGVEVQVHDTSDGDPDLERVTLEETLRGTTEGASSIGARATLSGGVRAAVESALDRTFSAPGRDRLRIERRDGRLRAQAAWDFGSEDFGLGELGFRLVGLSWEEGRDPELLAAEVPINSHWWELNEHLRVRLRGQLSFQPNWPALLAMVRNAVARAGVAASASLEGSAAAAAGEAGALTLEESFAAAMVAGAEAGMELLPAVALVGLIGTMVASVALVGWALAYEAGRAEREGRRRRSRGGPLISHELFDERMTDIGADFHDRIGAFCAGYVATMRGETGAPAGAASSAGMGAANDWIRELRMQGIDAADIHAAARSAPDLEARVLASARPAFQQNADDTIPHLLYAAYRIGHDDRDREQAGEWMTRYLRSCITLDAAPPAPEYRFDACRTAEPDVDYSDCPPGGESDPDAPPTSVGTDSAAVGR
jgi:hypothetical protein